MGTVTRIGIEDLVEATGTSGMHRWLAMDGDGFWAGIVTTDPDAASGWHHHDGHDSLVYLLEGRMRIEWGDGGAEGVLAGTGEFLHIPAHTVHREVNPDGVPARALLVRVGEGEPVVNVDRPD